MAAFAGVWNGAKTSRRIGDSRGGIGVGAVRMDAKRDRLQKELEDLRASASRVAVESEGIE